MAFAISPYQAMNAWMSHLQTQITDLMSQILPLMSLALVMGLMSSLVGMFQSQERDLRQKEG